jgi:hypothetical protein
MQIQVVFDAWTMAWLVVSFLVTASAIAYCVSFLNQGDRE